VWKIIRQSVSITNLKLLLRLPPMMGWQGNHWRIGEFEQMKPFFCRCPVTNESYMFTDPERSHPEVLIDIARRHGISIIRIYRMVKMLVSDMIDPLASQDRIGTFEFKWEGAPDPFANVDLAAALGHALKDARHNDKLLEDGDNLTLRTALNILRNTVTWLKFWAARHPHPIWRQRYVEAVEEAEADARAIIATARAKGIEIKELADG
jgi:hypothetical protein